jgi:hypothetical protein
MLTATITLRLQIIPEHTLLHQAVQAAAVLHLLLAAARVAVLAGLAEVDKCFTPFVITEKHLL